MSQLVLYASFAALASLLGGILVIWHAKFIKKIMTPLIAFAAGTFIGLGFIDLLPEAVEMVDEPHDVFLAALVGFTLFFALERFLMKYFYENPEGHESHGEHTESLAPLVVLGDTLHNFLDGIVIALAFIANPAVGIGVAFAVIAHEIPQEIGDFSVLLDQGWSKAKVMIVNLVSSIFLVLGAIIGYSAAMAFEGSIAFLLAGTAGVFIYIAASDLIPEVHHRAGHSNFWRILFSFGLGLILVWFLVGIAH